MVNDFNVRCCICDKWEPKALQKMADVTFVGWLNVTFAGTGHIIGYAQL